MMKQEGQSSSAPVFVVGMNGSGTSMMLDSLGRHPQLYALPDETLMMPYIIMRAHRFGDLTDDANFLKLWRFAIDEIPALVRFNGGSKPEVPTDWNRFPRTIAGVFDGIYSALAAKKGKRRWCEKTPDHVQHLPLLSATFPDARFIHLIRDGREVSCSINRRQHRTPELVIYRWKKLVEMGQIGGRALGDRYIEIRYEDLTADPESQMRRACRFLEVEFSPEVLQSRMPQNPTRRALAKGQLGEISSNPTKWPDYFDARTVGKLEAIGGKKLTELGYEVATHGDSDPGRVRRRFWRYRDFLRLTRRRVKSGARFRSWGNVARFLYFSIKQYGSKRY